MWIESLKWFSEDGFMPHGHCFLWTPSLLWAFVVSDGLIAASYYSIPVLLWYFLKRRQDAPFPGLASLFAIFILACGTTHVMDIIDIWHPLYRLDAAFRALTAFASTLTAVTLYYKLPVLLAFPSRAELEAANAALKQEVATRLKLEEDLQELNRTLELKVHVRTQDLEALNAELLIETIERRKAEEHALLLNATLEHRVRERTRELELANRELESFSYSVAHDLRAPVRAVIGFTEALRTDFGSSLPSGAGDFLELIDRGGQRMRVLIDSMLDLSRLTRTEMVCVPVDLSHIARDVADTLQIEQPRKDVKVLIAGGLNAVGDPKYLRIALENLLGNAWKYSAKVQHAVIEFGRNDTSFFVRDNGAGFDMRHATNLFGVFQRLHGENEFPGLGIGLATVQRIVAKHGGRIHAEAERGRGATFYFSLNVAIE